MTHWGIRLVALSVALGFVGFSQPAVQAQYPSLTVNTEPSALQQSDCRGNVVAHIPVASTLISELSAVGQR